MITPRDRIVACEQGAALNHGVIALTTARAEGMSDSAIARVLASGRWVRLFRGAYAVAGAPRTWRMELAGVAASLGPHFAFSHRTAGALLGLDGVREGHLDIITKGMPDLPGVTTHRITGRWPRTVRIEGFRITTAHRTILDCFAGLPHRCATDALEDALRKRIVAIDPLWNEYLRTCARGRNGCRGFRLALLALDHRDGKLQSRMERKLRRIVQRLPGPEAEPQYSVSTPRGRYVLDFAYPDIKLGIEAHSIRWHMGQAKFYYDVRRDRALQGCGWTMLYFSWDDLLRPDEVGAEIEAFRDSLERDLVKLTARRREQA